MYAQIITFTGWTWDYIGQCMDLPRVNALFAQWEVMPPAARSLAHLAAAKGAWKPGTPRRKGKRAKKGEPQSGLVPTSQGDSWIMGMIGSSESGSI